MIEIRKMFILKIRRMNNTIINFQYKFQMRNELNFHNTVFNNAIDYN